jgi:CHAT domain-containing protein
LTKFNPELSWSTFITLHFLGVSFMRRPRVKNRLRHPLRLLFAAVVLICIWWGSLSGLAFGSYGLVAQATDVQQLVQTGVTRYETGDFVGALEPWLEAYSVYETTQELPALAIVSENLARTYQQLGQSSTELTYWERAILYTKNSANATTPALKPEAKLARLLSEQAQAYSRLGQNRRAIALLCGEPTTNLPTNGARAFFRSPLNAESCQSGSALQLAQATEDPLGHIAALGSLGEALRLSGDTAQAMSFFEQGVQLSCEANLPAMQSALLAGLGNTTASLAQVTYRRASEAESRGDGAAASFRTTAEQHNAAAIEYLQQSYQLAQAQASAADQMRALLSLIPAYERAGETAAAQQHWQAAQLVLDQLANSQMKAFAAIQLADLLESSSVRDPQALSAIPSAGFAIPLEGFAIAPPPPVEQQTSELLNQALAMGETLNNQRIIAFALGKLGHLDERAKRYPAALDKTQRARLAADQDLASQDSLYLLEWQLGRIFKAQGNLADATIAYGQAVEALDQIRSDILSGNQDVQFDFRDTVEPLYRQYAALNLQAVPPGVLLQKGEQAFDRLDAVLVTLDSLKVAELQSYFANDCVIAPTTTRVDAVGESKATAVVSTAILEIEELSPAVKKLKQLVVIVSLPNGSKKVSQTTLESQEIEQVVRAFRYTLESGGHQYMPEYNFDPSQQLYNWIIEPFKEELKAVKTLVFVNDGLLRGLPMAALHDGEKYLIEQFAVATTPSLTLTDPQQLNRPTALSALLMGMSESSQIEGRVLKELPAVAQEISTVAERLPNHDVLLNENFSVAALKSALAQRDYRILHMATHGTFGFDPVDNYIVTGASDGTSGFNETLSISELDSLVRSVNDPAREPIELLTLTACETAIGDSRSTLGLAGVAIRGGVRSAIATLWSISDDSSAEVISRFYEKLQQPGLTKAEALQQAQIAMIKSNSVVNQHPYRWAPFLLIGNWL